jgi:Nickel responsive protein SCO4226-like
LACRDGKAEVQFFKEDGMHKFVIEREIPGAGNLSAQQLQGISQKSCGVLQELGPKIQWVQSYVTGDKVYCIYLAESEQLIREHAKRGGFPADRISEVQSVIDPTTAG